MAFGDNIQSFDSATDTGLTLDLALNRVYDTQAKAQFVRQGTTSKWFNPRGTALKGRAHVYRAWIQPSTGVRRAGFASGRTTEFPAARDLAYQDLSVIHSDLVLFRASVKFNELDEMKTKDREHSIADLALKIVGDVEEDFATQINSALNQSSYCYAAKIHTMYTSAGVAWADNSDGYGADAAVFMRIKDGSISQFQKGEILDIYDSASTAGSEVQRAQCIVHDVIYGKDGPWTSGVKVANIGPGLIVEPCNADGTLTSTDGGTFNCTSDWDQVAAPDADDYIARSGEFTMSASAPNNFHGFPDWRDSNVNVFRDEGGTLQDREAAGSAWQMPEVVVVAAAGSEVAFDIDTHFREAEDVLPFRVMTARDRRGKMAGAPEIKQSMVAITTPDIVNEAVRDGADNVRFTTTSAMNLDAAKSKSLFGSVGFEGIVYHSATLGTIAMQADIAAQPHVVSLIDPNSFFWVTFGGTPSSVAWLDNGGSRFSRLKGATLGTETFYKQGAAWTAAALACDHIAANCFITGVKSSQE